MKIVCMIRSLQLGGAERQLIGLASCLSKAGHDCTVLVYHKENFYNALASKSSVKTVLLEKGSGGTFPFCRRLAAFLKGNGVELLIAFLPGPSIKACIVKMLCPSLKVIVSERNCSPHLNLYDILRLSLFKKADMTVSNSYTQTDFICRHFPSLAAKTRTIVNFAPLDEFKPEWEPSSNPDGAGCAQDFSEDTCSDGPARIIVTARLCRRKNALGLIEAAALLKEEGKDFRILWYGAPAKCTSYYKRCLRAIRRHSLEEHFKILPAAHSDSSLYNGADVFCLPSFYEGTSNSLAEALCCGLPVVCSAVSDSPIYVKEGKNGWLFDPTDISSIRNALSLILELTPSERRSFGLQSRTIALSRLGHTAFRNGWLQAVQEAQGFHNIM